MVTAHLEAADAVGWRNYATVERALPTWQSWIFTGRRNLLYRELNQSSLFEFDSGPGQHSNGVGLLATVVCLFGLLKQRHRPAVKTILITTGVVILVSTKLWGDLTLWRIIYDFLPGAQAIRYVARIGIFLAIPGAVGLACFLSTYPHGWKRAAATLVAVVCFSEQLHVLSGHSEEGYRDVVKRVASEVRPNSEAFLLVTVPSDGSQVRRRSNRRVAHLVAMWASMEAGVPTINGFYGNDPPGWKLRAVETRTTADLNTVDLNFERWVSDHRIDRERIDRLDLPSIWLDPVR